MTDPDLSLKEARRIEILNAASELLATQPAASLAEIAEYAKIGKATLHRYFASRDDLMLALGYQALETVSAAIAASLPEHGTAVEALTRVIEVLVPLGDKLHFLFSQTIFETHPDFVAAERSSEAPLLALIRQAQASGELRSDLSADWILHHLNYALFATWQAVHDGSVARRDAPRLLVMTVLGGIVPR